MSAEELLSKFFIKLGKINSGGERDEYSVRDALEDFKKAMEADNEGRYSVLNLLLVNLSDNLLGLKDEEVIEYLLKSYDGLVACFKKALKLWLRNTNSLIDHLESIGAIEHPLASVFILSEILGLMAPQDAEAYVIRGNIYLNYLKILKEYERMSNFPLREQSERAFKNAYNLFVRAISIDVNNYEGYLGLARLYTLIGDLDNAITNYENALRCNRTTEALKELAEVYRLKGDLELANKYLKECESR